MKKHFAFRGWGLGPVLFAAAVAASYPASAQQSFKGPIRIVVSSAPGAGIDLVARVLGPHLSKELGQTVVIENKPGANGMIAAQQVMAAPPNGTMILCTVDHTMIVLPATTPDVKFKASTDFTALGHAAKTYWTLVAPAQAGYGSFRDYVGALQREPLLRSYGAPWNGGAPTAVGSAVGKYANVKMVEVPYLGSGPVLQNVLAGQVPAGTMGMPGAVNVHRTGKAKVLAVTGSARSPRMPDVPTFKELGVAGLESVTTIVSFFGPRDMPPAMAQEFNAALRKALANPDIEEKFAGQTPAPTTLEEVKQDVIELEQFWKNLHASQQPAR
ncbi:tripartite tricarboxylate transporter substrate-binding protein [Ramlibacter sp.]|uniref:tripartite tricarboxylate transporter substrate-binding protein n=1 Tax=Ramlibacter sp. TaxID=1917967 RepID=UPI003D114ED9